MPNREGPNREGPNQERPEQEGAVPSRCPGSGVRWSWPARRSPRRCCPATASPRGLVAGISGILGYGLGLLVAAAWRAVRDRDARPPRPRSWTVLAVAAVVFVALFTLVGAQWQAALRALMGAPAEPVWRTLLAPVVALGTFAVLLGLARGVRGLGLGLARLLARLGVGARAARALAVLGLVAVALYRYTRESVDAWATVLRPPDWTPQKADRLRALVAGG